MMNIVLVNRFKRRVGTAKITPVRLAKPREDYDGASVHITHATLPAGEANAETLRDLRRYFTTQGSCGCAGDCCGCPSSDASLIRISRRRYLVRISTTLNY